MFATVARLARPTNLPLLLLLGFLISQADSSSLLDTQRSFFLFFMSLADIALLTHSTIPLLFAFAATSSSSSVSHVFGLRPHHRGPASRSSLVTFSTATANGSSAAAAALDPRSPRRCHRRIRRLFLIPATCCSRGGGLSGDAAAGGCASTAGWTGRSLPSRKMSSAKATSKSSKLTDLLKPANADSAAAVLLLSSPELEGGAGAGSVVSRDSQSATKADRRLSEEGVAGVL